MAQQRIERDQSGGGIGESISSDRLAGAILQKEVDLKGALDRGDFDTLVILAIDIRQLYAQQLEAIDAEKDGILARLDTPEYGDPRLEGYRFDILEIEFAAVSDKIERVEYLLTNLGAAN